MYTNKFVKRITMKGGDYVLEYDPMVLGNQFFCIYREPDADDVIADHDVIRIDEESLRILREMITEMLQTVNKNDFE